MTGDENILLKRQLEELREQLNKKDFDLKNYHRTIADLEKQLTETENVRMKRFFSFIIICSNG
jgi:chromosome segregation ATPase